MKAIEKLKEVARLFESSGIEAAEKEAEMLVRHSFGLNTVEIYRDNPEPSEKQIKTLESMLSRRLKHEPIQYVLGHEEFLGMKILVKHGVLIPRTETELMAEQAIKAVISYKLQVTSKNKDSSLVTLHRMVQGVTRHSSLSILDLCTGSGCLALALAREFPDFKVYGTDISGVAIGCAIKNAEINGIKNVIFLKGNLFEPIEKLPTSNFQLPTFDLIISNPPYIRTDDIKNLQPEIKEWEPIDALNGGVDGLDFYRVLIPSARSFLKDNGIIMLELGFGQSSDVVDIFESAGYAQIEIIKDYAGIERIIKARWKR
ncbi:MAG: peptide chain release factor N(5)-glutamine methyltransferase [Thermodesulfovibrionia bacterium]|nr:peptide chain release factor N(5)-glutamine methyltransferase [Thermodesulfovibrionia bacterium]